MARRLWLLLALTAGCGPCTEQDMALATHACASVRDIEPLVLRRRWGPIEADQDLTASACSERAQEAAYIEGFLLAHDLMWVPVRSEVGMPEPFDSLSEPLTAQHRVVAAHCTTDEIRTGYDAFEVGLAETRSRIAERISWCESIDR